MKNLVRENGSITMFVDTVARVNVLTTHGYLFLKLLLLHFIEKEPFKFPIVDKEFICDIFRVIGVRTTTGGRPITEDNASRHEMITNFYKQRYYHLIPSYDNLNYDHLGHVVPYSAIEMETNINNNIFMRFEAHFIKYMKTCFNMKQKKLDIRKNFTNNEERKKQFAELFRKFNSVCQDILFFTEEIENPEYRDYIISMRTRLFGNKPNTDKKGNFYNLLRNVSFKRKNALGKFETKLEKRTFTFYIKQHPEKYLYSFIMLAKLYEEYNIINEQKIKLFNIIPLQTSLVPNHICIDNQGLIDLLPKGSYKNWANDNKKQKSTIWNWVFNLNRKEFRKKNHNFHFMIKTDGVACSVVFTMSSSIENNYVAKKSKYEEMQYIQDRIISEKKDQNGNIQRFLTPEGLKMKEMTKVCIDPGMQDLIHCGAYVDGEFRSMRYTQNQRRFETKLKKYQKLREKIKTQYVQYCEQQLSLLNSKVNSYAEFRKYVLYKNYYNISLRQHYSMRVFRKVNFYSFINTQKSEARMMNNFKKIFGEPKSVCIGYGDWSKGSFNAPGHEPTISKKLRRMFVEKGYQTNLLNEYRTSITCNECGGELSKFFPKEKKGKNGESKEVLCHGLLRCETSKEQSCKTVHNRDKNAVKNMIAILDHLFEFGARPKEFSRKWIADQKRAKILNTVMHTSHVHHAQ